MAHPQQQEKKMRTAWALLSPYTRLERSCHVEYVSRVWSCGHEVVYSHLGRSSHERVGRDPWLSGNFPGMRSWREAQHARKAQVAMVPFSSADDEWEKPEQFESGGFNSLTALGLEDNVEDQGDSDPLVVVDESGAGWAGEDFRKQSGGETVNMKPNNPGQSVAATQANSQQHAKSDYKLDRLEDEEQDGDPFAMVEHGQSFKNETGKMSKQLEGRGTETIGLKAAQGSESNLLFLEERGGVVSVVRSAGGPLLEPTESASVVAPLRNESRKQLFLAAEKELGTDLQKPFLRRSVDNVLAVADRGECTVQDLVEEEGRGRMGRHDLITLPEGVTTNPPDTETLAKGASTFKESTEPGQDRTLSPQESASGESTPREDHDDSRKLMREGSGNDYSDIYSDGKVSRDAANPGTMQSTERVRGTTGLEGLSADEVEEILIEAGILHRDGAMFDIDELSDEGVYNEVDVPDGSEACRILVDALGCDEAEINHLRDRYAPLRGEAWYRREPIPGSKVGKKVLDVFFLEETLPELLDLLLGDEGEGGVGLAAKQVREMLLKTPALVGVEASDASDVVAYLGDELGLNGKGQLAEALARCPPMLMYNVQDNLRKKVQYYLDTLPWSKEDVRSMLAEYPYLLSIKLEDGVIEVVEYLRSGIDLQPSIVGDMIRQYPQILEARPKRLKAVVKYLWKVFEIPMSDIAVILSKNPRACFLEAEANLAPLRHFFEQELFVEDTARIGRLVYKFPRLLFQDVETQLKPRAEEFRKAMGLIGVQPLPPRVRPRPKRNNYRAGDTKHNSGVRNRGKRRSGDRFGGKEGRRQERRGNGGQSRRNH